MHPDPYQHKTPPQTQSRLISKSDIARRNVRQIRLREIQHVRPLHNRHPNRPKLVIVVKQLRHRGTANPRNAMRMEPQINIALAALPSFALVELDRRRRRSRLALDDQPDTLNSVDKFFSQHQSAVPSVFLRAAPHVRVDVRKRIATHNSRSFVNRSDAPDRQWPHREHRPTQAQIS